MNERESARALYRKLLALYPRVFRDKLGESMEQTFNDLYKERQGKHGWFGFVMWVFLETGAGAIREHVLIMAQGDSMKTLISNPTSAAITSVILSMPIGLTFVAFMFEIEQLAKHLTELFTTNGYDLNVVGRVFLFGGLFLLPIAFILNLRPILKREEPEGKRSIHAINLIVGVVITLLIIFAWGGLLLEEIYCLQGIRCD